MDSGNNSGSLQSSSGGSEEYDSRAAAADSISAFLNQTPPPQHPSTHHQMGLTPSSAPPPVFDSLYNFDPNLSRSPPNLDMVWSKNLRSDPNCTDLGWFMAAAPPTLTNQHGGGGGGGGNGSAGLSFSSIHFPQGGVSEKGLGVGVRAISGSGTVSGTDQISTVRNPKKRSRASRRAPTTVLTTDTTNFRAMVQEFTGIPAPPFTSSHFPRTRLDLFGTTASSMRSNSHLDPSPPPPFLLRPFAQKIQHHPSMVDAVAATTTGIINTNGLKPAQHVLESPGFNFQTLLQSPPKYPIPSLGNKIQSLEEFGLSSQEHGNNTTISNMASMSRTDNTCHNLGSWGDVSGAGQHKINQTENEALLKSVDGNRKVGFSGDQIHYRAPENAGAGRSEGMVESWICSSD